jgi:hypothetical protein
MRIGSPGLPVLDIDREYLRGRNIPAHLHPGLGCAARGDHDDQASVDWRRSRIAGKSNFKTRRGDGGDREQCQRGDTVTDLHQPQYTRPVIRE